MRRGSKIIIAIILLAASIAFITYIYLKSEGGSLSIPDNYISVKKSSEYNSTEKTVNFLNWKTYRNEEYGIELRYPTHWFFEATSTQLGKEKILDIHIANDISSDNDKRACPRRFASMEMQVGHTTDVFGNPRDPHQNFFAFVESSSCEFCQLA